MPILRQLNLQSSGRRILGTPNVGVPGSDTLVVGTSGNGMLGNDVLRYGLQSDLVRAEVVSHNCPPNSLFVNENGTFSLVGAPDGVYTIFYRLYINGVASTLDLGYGPGVGVVTLTIGAGVALPVPIIVPYEAFLTDVLPWVPGCPDGMVIAQVRQACIEFFQRTLAWRSRLPAIEAVAGYSDYPMPLPAQSSLAKLLRYYVDGRAAVVANVYNGNSQRSFDTGCTAAWTVDRTIISVNPSPNAGQLLEVDAALKPSQASSGIFEFLWEQYREQLKHGALARLLAMPNQPWSDLPLAASHSAMFGAAITRVGAQAGRAFGSATPRTRGFFF